MFQRLFACLAIVSAGSIVVGSFIHPSYLPSILPDLWLHGTAYFIVALAIAGAIESNRGAAVMSMALICMGGFVELLQFWVPARDGRIFEAVANGVGVILGYVVRSCITAFATNVP